MSDRKPKIQVASLEGSREAHFAIPPDDEKTQFNTNLPISLVEKLRALSFWDDVQMNDVIAGALGELVARREAERGEPYEVLPPHRVKRRR